MASTLHKDLGLFKIPFLVTIIALGLAAVTVAALADQEERTFDVEVQVLADGKPAEGATVWIEERSGQADQWKTIRTVGPLMTPKPGFVRLRLNAGAGTYSVFARNDQGDLALGTCLPRKKKTGEASEGKNRITLTLTKTRQIKGQLFFANKPVANAQCKLNTIGSRMELESAYLDQIIATHIFKQFAGYLITAKTDREGRFVFDGIPEKAEAGIVVDKQGLGHGSFAIAAGKSIEVELVLGGKLEVSVEGETKPTFIKGVQLDPTNDPVVTTPQGRRLVSMTSGPSIQRSDFSVPGVAGHEKGTYRLSIPVDPALPYHLGNPQEVTIEPEKTTKVILKKFPVANCSGRIINAKTGKGIPKMSFRLEGIVKSKEGVFANSSRKFNESYLGETDGEGDYSIVCKGNHDYTLTFAWQDNRTDYELPRWDLDRREYTPVVPHLFVADAEKGRFPDVALVPSRVVTGVVKDESGRPVDGPYEVHCLTRHTRDQKPAQIDKGQFTLSQLKPDVPLKFYIRKGKAVNVAKIFTSDQLNAPLEFTIGEKNKTSCAGRIVDAEGKPIAKAKVSLIWMSDYQGEMNTDGKSMGLIGKLLETLETDDQGKFAASGLWPGERFYVRVTAKGYQPWAPPNEGCYSGQAAAGGGPLDFGDIVLIAEKPKE